MSSPSAPPEARPASPTSETVSSAADAMLRLSASVPDGQTPHYAGDYQVNSPESSGSLSPGRAGLSQRSPGDEFGIQRPSRKQREFIPEFRKDDHYWQKRRKNNEAAKRSREKRRTNDYIMSKTISHLTGENDKLKRELAAIKRKFGIPSHETFGAEEKETGFGDNEGAYKVTGELLSPSSGHEMAQENLALPAAPQIRWQQGSETPSLQSPAPPKMPALAPIVGLPRVSMGIAHAVHAAPRLMSPLSCQTTSPYSSSPTPYQLLTPHDQTQGLPQVHGAPYRPPVSNTCPTAPPLANGAPQDSESRGSNQSSGITFSTGENSNDSSHSLKISLSVGGSSSDNSDNGKSNNVLAPLNLSQPPKEPLLTDASVERKGGEAELPPQKKSRSMMRKGLPVKLRHKTTPGEEQDDSLQEWESAALCNGSENSHHGSQRGLQGTSENDLHLLCVSSTSDDDTSNSGGNQLDPKYVERRKRNNMAARKCRENRRMLMDIRVAKSQILESENNQLKDELRHLSAEISSLKEMLDKKKQAMAKGECFDPPAGLEPTGHTEKEK